jgi:hypothetical protein
VGKVKCKVDIPLTREDVRGVLECLSNSHINLPTCAQWHFAIISYFNTLFNYNDQSEVTNIKDDVIATVSGSHVSNNTPTTFSHLYKQRQDP